MTPRRQLSLTVGEEDRGARLDQVIAARGGISRGLARRTLAAGGVFVNRRRCKVAGRQVRPGQQIEVHLEEPSPGRPAATVPSLSSERLLFVDHLLVAVDKPAGIPAQATRVTDRGTLPDLVSRRIGGPLFVVHRLDQETSGVTLLARSRRTAQVLGDAFRQNAVTKTYLALCAIQSDEPRGRVEAPLGPDPRRRTRQVVVPDGPPAVTRFETLARHEAAAQRHDSLPPPGAPRTIRGSSALVAARPETGRTHQIRAHLAHLSAPVLGDTRYGGPRERDGVTLGRVMLHAWRLELAHPGDGHHLTLEAPLPDDFADACHALVGTPPLPSVDDERFLARH